MTLTELIRHLTDLARLHGDLPVHTPYGEVVDVYPLDENEAQATECSALPAEMVLIE